MTPPNQGGGGLPKGDFSPSSINGLFLKSAIPIHNLGPNHLHLTHCEQQDQHLKWQLVNSNIDTNDLASTYLVALATSLRISTMIFWMQLFVYILYRCRVQTRVRFIIFVILYRNNFCNRYLNFQQPPQKQYHALILLFGRRFQIRQPDLV